MKRLSAVAFLLGLVALAAVFVWPLFGSNVYAGVKVDGVDVGGKSKEEVMQLLNEWRNDSRQSCVVACYGDTKLKLKASDIDFDVDVDGTLGDVMNYGRQGSWWMRLRDIRNAKREGHSVSLKFSYDTAKMDSLFDKWRELIDRPARNAALSVLSGGVIPQEEGRKLDVKVLQSMVLEALHKNETGTIALPVQIVFPQITIDDIARSGIKESLGVFATTFNVKDVNRTDNIKTAVRKINGCIINPGEIFSFNDTVGSRDKASGFKEALEIVNGELVPGIGGGVCQVSSTLYNAVLLSNLKAIERYNHSKPLVYVPLGRDATVVYDVLDFKFVNNSEAPVMIIAETAGSDLHIGIFGRQHLKEKIEVLSIDQKEILPAIINKQDPDLLINESKVEKEGKPGYEVTVVRVVRLNGRELKWEVLSKDRYLPDDTIIRVGVKPPSFTPKKK